MNTNKNQVKIFIHNNFHLCIAAKNVKYTWATRLFIQVKVKPLMVGLVLEGIQR